MFNDNGCGNSILIPMKESHRKSMVSGLENSMHHPHRPSDWKMRRWQARPDKVSGIHRFQAVAKQSRRRSYCIFQWIVSAQAEQMTEQTHRNHACSSPRPRYSTIMRKSPYSFVSIHAVLSKMYSIRSRKRRCRSRRFRMG